MKMILRNTIHDNCIVIIRKKYYHFWRTRLITGFFTKNTSVNCVISSRGRLLITFLEIFVQLRATLPIFQEGFVIFKRFCEFKIQVFSTFSWIFLLIVLFILTRNIIKTISYINIFLNWITTNFQCFQRVMAGGGITLSSWFGIGDAGISTITLLNETWGEDVTRTGDVTRTEERVSATGRGEHPDDKSFFRNLILVFETMLWSYELLNIDRQDRDKVSQITLIHPTIF